MAMEETTLPNDVALVEQAHPVSIPENNQTHEGLAKEDEGALVVVDCDGNSDQDPKKKEQAERMLLMMRKDKGKLPQCVESRMDTIRSAEVGHEATGSSSNDPSSTGNNRAMSNTDHPNGRIAVGWDASKVQLQCIDSSAQWLTVEIRNQQCMAGMRIT
ncbi:hypothetical protein OIU74_008414, partial [Salix koriyanagi]